MAPKNHPGVSSGRTVKARDLQYIQRPADAELLAHCRDGRPAYILHSPQMGKSSLIAHTAERLNANSHHAVLIDLSQFSLPPREEEWFHTIVRILDDSLDLSTDVMSWWEHQKTLAPHIRLGTLLTEVILPEMTKPLVLFIDEIERTVALPFHEHFFEWLTTLYKSRTTNSVLYRLSFVVCGVATPSQLIPEGGPLLFQWSHRVVLSDFTLQEALPLAEGLSLPTEAAIETVKWVYDWTKGHPYLTQLLCRVLEEQHRMTWLEDEVNECIRHFIVSPQGLREPNFQFVRTALTEPDAYGESLLEPYLDLLEGRTENLTTNPAALEQLRLVGVLREDEKEIAIRNPLYQEVFPLEWVKRHLPSPAAITQSAASQSVPSSSPTPQSVTLPPAQHSYVMAASLFLIGVGLLLWFFSEPVSQPLSVTAQNAPSALIESSASPPDSTDRPGTPQQPEALTQAQEKIQELETTIVRYQQLSSGEVQSLIHQRTQLETQLASKDRALSNLQAQVQTLKAALNDQRDAQEHTIVELQTQRAQWQTMATTTGKELESALKEVKTLQMAILTQSSLSPSEINKLMADSSQLQTQLKTANTELARAHERSRELESLLTQQKQLLQTENQGRTEDRTRLETTIKGLETTIADTRQMLLTEETRAQEQAKLAQSELNRLQQDRIKYQKLLSASQEELSSLKTQTVNLESTLTQKYRAKQNQALEEALQANKRLEDQLLVYQNQGSQRLNRVVQPQAELPHQKPPVEDLILSLQPDRDRLTEQLINAQSELQATHTQMSTLSAQMVTTETGFSQQHVPNDPSFSE